MTLNCLVIDDEPLARMHIENYINKFPFLKVCGSARNAAIAQNILAHEAIDLIFLDIKMPQTSGIEFLLQNNIFQQVIFITAYPEFALNGFELDVADYLVKPVTFERFEKAVNKVYDRIAGFDNMRQFKHKPDFVYVKTNQRYEKIEFGDIYYIESMLNYISIITKQGKYVVYSSMKNAENLLPPDRFLRIHKSYIISVDKIDAIELQRISINQAKIPVSRGKRTLVIDAAQKMGLMFNLNN